MRSTASAFDPGARTVSGEQCWSGSPPPATRLSSPASLPRTSWHGSRATASCARTVRGRAAWLQLNLEIERWLTGAGLIEPRGTFYENRPILITRTTTGSGLFNGDVGVVVQDHERRLRVCFQGTGGLRFLRTEPTAAARDGVCHDHPQEPGLGI
jgi:hypothetical protein